MTVLGPKSLTFALSLALVMTGAASVVAQEDPAARAVLPIEGAAAVDAAVPVPQDPAASGDAVVEREDVALGAGAKVAPSGPASKATDAKPEANVPDAGDPPAAEGGPVVQTLGEGDQKVFLVDHKGKWSMHFENVLTNNVVLHWEHAGGPDVTMKVPVDRPFTMSVHEVAPEVILERLFEGYGYTLHYDDSGRLTSVRVYSPRESLAFKTPRLTESLGDWKKAETEPEAAAAQPPPP